MYNLTNLTNANNTLQVVVAVNEMSNNYLGLLILACFFLISFIALKKYDGDTKKVLVASSAITSVFAVPMWTLGLVSNAFVIYPILIFFASIIIFWISKQ